MISKEKKAEIIAQYGRKAGIPVHQKFRSAILTEGIAERPLIFNQESKGSSHSRRGLLMMVGHRRGLLDYLKKTDLEGYRVLIEKLQNQKVIYESVAGRLWIACGRPHRHLADFHSC